MKLKSLVLTLALLAAQFVGAQVTPTSKHVVVIMDENHRYSDVLVKMPYLVSLGNKYAHMLNYHADVSGSLMDYLWISSGSSEKAFGCNGGGCSSPITSDNIFREVNAAGLSWKTYQESIPSVGYMGYSSGLYVKRHNPAAYYSDIINSKTEQQKIVPFTQFAVDLANNQLPNYSFITPNLLNDAHNQPAGTDALVTADKWLAAQMPQLLNSPYFQPGGDGLLIITFDECDGAAGGACGGANELVYTAVIGPKVKPGSTSAVLYKHENALRTALESLGIKNFPGASATAVAMNDVLRPDGLVVTSPLDNSVNTTSVIVKATDPKASRIEVWVDHIKRFQVTGGVLDTKVTLTAGTHRFVVTGIEGTVTVTKVATITVK